MPNSRASKRIIYGLMGKIKLMGGAIKRKVQSMEAAVEASPRRKKLRAMMDEGFEP